MRRVDTPAEVIELLPTSGRIYGGQLGGTPMALLNALHAGRDHFESIDVVTGYLVDAPRLIDAAGSPFRFVTLQPSGAVRQHVADGRLEAVPARFSEFSALLGPTGPLRIDVLFLAVSEPGPSGRRSLGTSVGVTAELVRVTPMVVAMENPQMPFSLGAGELDDADIDVIVTVDEPLPEATPPSIDPVSEAIAGHVVSLVPDGGTVQFGIGAIPEAVLAQLIDRSGLRLHGGLVSPAARRLVEAGALAGPIRAAEALGDADFYHWLDGNDAVEMIASRQSHGAAALAGLDSFVALNSAVEVAHDGSVNSEWVGDRRISGPGGAPDFAAAASMIVGARSIIALPSTARGDKSRIVERLTPPAGATIPASLADVVVTEHGIAELRGRTLEQRAAALRSISG